MLRHLHITNFVLIEQCQLDFGAGLCVLTGETGAGKSILLDALGLVLGGRLSGAVLRDTSKPASITAEFTLNSATRETLTEAGILVDDNTLLLKRIVMPEGGSNRCLVNDQPVSVNLLKTLGDQLVEIHGQHGQRDLTDLSRQRTMLDDSAALGAEVQKLGKAYAQWQEAKTALETLEAELKEARREEEYLRHVAQELSQLNPQSEEEDELSNERNRLMKAEQLGSLLVEALRELKGAASLYNAQRMLMRSDAMQVEELQAVVDTLERAQIESGEAVQMLTQVKESYGYDPHKLEQVEERLFALRAAARKNQCSVSDLTGLRDRIKASLSTLNSQEKLLAEKQQIARKAKEVYQQLAEALSAKRSKAADKMAKSVMAELGVLKMAATRFHAKIERLEEANWNSSGMDRVCFEVSTNPGSPFGALHKIASGGELSRFMLALKVVMAESKSDTTLIFDEIDAGTSGIVADAIGDRLAKLGTKQQVMVITHLPQVAGKGSTHFKVAKEQTKKTTQTTVTLLDKSQRQEELAQMLSGKEITAEARKAAAMLLEKTA
jgi:DNA repair protein RecN (Recombination protein N)